MGAMIRIKKLRKTFGPTLAVDDVSFEVERGEVLGFLGPNGAGKSTTMKMVTGFLTPTDGTADVCGHDVVRQPLAVKQSLGYLPEGAPGYPDMTPDSFLRFVAEVRGYRGRERRERVDRVARLIELDDVMRQPIETLSKGFKRRVGLAQALIHDPEVLIMDEPTDGLDPNQKHQVRSLIHDMAERKAIVLSTHILEEVDAVCSRVVVISRGRVVADGTPTELQQHSRYHNAVLLAVRADENALVDELSRLATVESVERLASENGLARCRVFARDRRPIVSEVSQQLRAKQWEIDELHVEEGRLNEVFRSMTTGDAGKGAA